jgi:hypothetical protein
MSDPAASVNSCSWEHLPASVPAGPAPIAARIERDSLFDWYKPPPTEEHCMWELLSNARVGIPAVLASNAVLLAIGFFLGRRSITLDLSLYI